MHYFYTNIIVFLLQFCPCLGSKIWQQAQYRETLHACMMIMQVKATSEMMMRSAV